MRGAALGGKGEQGDAGPDAEQCRASCAVETAMSASCSTVGSGITPQSAMNSTPFSPKRESSTSMIMQLEAVVVLRRHLDDLKQRPQHAARRVAGAGDEAVGLVHGEHHRAEIIRLHASLRALPELSVPCRGATS